MACVSRTIGQDSVNVKLQSRPGDTDSDQVPLAIERNSAAQVVTANIAVDLDVNDSSGENDNVDSVAAAHI